MNISIMLIDEVAIAIAIAITIVVDVIACTDERPAGTHKPKGEQRQK